MAVISGGVIIAPLATGFLVLLLFSSMAINIYRAGGLNFLLPH